MLGALPFSASRLVVTRKAAPALDFDAMIVRDMFAHNALDLVAQCAKDLGSDGVELFGVDHACRWVVFGLACDLSGEEK